MPNIYIKTFTMATKKSLDKTSHPGHSELPKHLQLIRMLSFRIVPAYYKKIEHVADDQGTTVSGLIRKYIKEGMVRDLEMKGSNTDFRIEE
jgi:hypothetical protein